MNEIQVFNNDTQGFHARTVTDDNDTVWFVAKDIATDLEYKESTVNNAINALMQSVPEIWKGKKQIFTPGGEQEMLCLTEQGVYFFLGRSDKKKALTYQIWIANDVVPSIRKHGVYLTPKAQEELISNPDFIIRLAQELKAERLKVKALKEQNDKNRPKVIFADAVDAADGSILIGNLAKILRQNGINIGQNRLFAWLRDYGYLMNCKGERWNMPTQSSLERGLFEVKKSVINNPDGSVKITHTTKVTGRGQIYFVNKFLTMNGGEANVIR